MRKSIGLFLVLVMVISLFIGAFSVEAADDSAFWQWPVDSTKVKITDVAHYAGKYPECHSNGHWGYDMVGDSNIKAIADGKVVATGTDKYYGVYIVISHNYNGKTYYSKYQHLKDKSVAVNTKDKATVTKGQKIAVMGDTGDSNGIHLHLEIGYKNNGGGTLRDLVSLERVLPLLGLSHYTTNDWNYIHSKEKAPPYYVEWGYAPACKHEEYDNKGECTKCGAEYPLKPTADVRELLTKNRDSKLTTVPVRTRPFSGHKVIADIPNGFVFYIKEKALNGKFTDEVENLWYKGDIFNPTAKKLIPNVWIYSGNLIPASPNHADHNFDSGFCSKCGTKGPAPSTKPTPKPEATTTPKATPKPTAAPSTTTTNVTEGEYVFRSGSVYLNATKDSEGGNVNAVTSNNAPAQKWDVKKSGSAYRVTSKGGSAKRVLNVYTEGKSAAGLNVTLWSVTGDKTQLWLFEKKGDGYILHPADNTSVALTVQSNNDVKLGANSGGTNQVWYLEAPSAAATEAPTPTPTPTATREPKTTPEPLPATTPKPTKMPAPTATEKPVQTPSVSQADIFLQAELVGNDKQAIGIKLNWEPSENALGYRIYRSDRKGRDGISISDFPINGGEYVDVNIDSYRDYYYTIRPVLAEASFHQKTGTLTSEKMGEASNEIYVQTPEIVTKMEQQRNFILMQIGKDTMRANEKTLEIDPGRGTTPAVVNGRTLVPIRAIIEAMGGTVGWNEEWEEITLEVNGHTVEMYLDRYAFFVDGEMSMLDVAPTAINGRTMLPVRFVAENIGCEIEWIGSTEQIVIVFYQ